MQAPGTISRPQSFVIHLLIASIFLDGFSIRRFAGFDFYYYYIIFLIGIVAVVFFSKKFLLGPRWFVNFISIFFLVNLLTGLIFETLGFLMIKQILGILFSAAAYWSVFVLAKGNLRFIAKAYVNIAFLEALYALIGLVVTAMNLGNFGVYELSGNFLNFPRLIGSTQEPYFLSVSLIPAVYIHLNNLFGPGSNNELSIGKFKGIVTIIVFLLTGASSGYLAIFVMLSFLAFNRNLLNVKSLGIILMPLFFYALYFLFTVFSSGSGHFNVRVTDTWYAFFSDDIETDKANRINGSSFALYSNFQVAKNSFATNPFSGSGIGTHELNYKQYFYKHFSSGIVRKFVAELNKQDANSTFIRLLSETGLFGLLFFLYFVFRNLSLTKVSSVRSSISLIVLFNQGIFVMMLIRLLRTGNYIGNGFFFFFFAYWAIYRYLKQAQPARDVLNSEETLDRYPQGTLQTG